MGEPDLTVFLIGGWIGIGLILLGFYSLRRLDPAMPIRVALGATLFIAGLVAVVVWPGFVAVVESPIYLGIEVCLLGLGINQVGAPLRRALGRTV